MATILAMNDDTPDPATTPVPAHVAEMAMQAVRDFHECFWWWNKDFVPVTVEAVRDVVLNLRKGGHRAWARAQNLNSCL